MKRISHGRSKFPSCRKELAGAVEQGPGEFQPEEVIALGVGNPQSPGAQRSGGFGESGRRSKRGAWNFKQDLCSRRQRPAHSNESATRADIQRSGKLKELF